WGLLRRCRALSIATTPSGNGQPLAGAPTVRAGEDTARPGSVAAAVWRVPVQRGRIAPPERPPVVRTGVASTRVGPGPGGRRPRQPRARVRHCEETCGCSNRLFRRTRVRDAE